MGKSLLVLVLLTNIAFFGCSDQTEIIFGIEYYPRLNEPESDLRFHTSQITNQLYETLIQLGDDYQTLKPNLVQNWKISIDGLVYSFTLRNDVLFHDQKKLTASDIKRTYEYYLQKRKYWTLADKIASVSAIDSFTVQFTLVSPNSQFLYMLCSPYIFKVMKTDSTKDTFNIPVGTGPYFLADTNDQKRIVLEKNDRYWNKDNKIDRIIFSVFNSDEECRQALIDGKVDIVYAISGNEIDRLRWKGKIKYYVQKSGNISFFGFNLANKPFDDIRVRRAVLHALNLPKIVYNLNRGNALVAKGPLPPVYNTNTEIQQGVYDPDKARLLLQQAGYENGIKIRCNFPQSALSRVTIVEAVQSELAKSQIYIEPMLLNTWQEHTDSVFSDNAQLFFDGAGSLFIGEPEYFLETLYHSQSRYNFFRYKSMMVDSLLEMTRVELDRSKRESAYNLIIQKIVEDVPAIFYAHVIPHFAYNSEKIAEISANPYQVVRFDQIRLNSN
jgi:peptide/nickel transport system substrate-binding protein